MGIIHEKPSEQIEDVYHEYHELIMDTRNDIDARELELKQIHAAISKIAEILDDLNHRL